MPSVTEDGDKLLFASLKDEINSLKKKIKELEYNNRSLQAQLDGSKAELKDYWALKNAVADMLSGIFRKDYDERD